MIERYYFYEDPDLGYVICDSETEEQLLAYYSLPEAQHLVAQLNNENNQ